VTEPRLTHLDAEATARMVDVSAKEETERVAVAEGRVRCDPETVRLVEAGLAVKGDVLGVARVAGVLAAKRTAELIPSAIPSRSPTSRSTSSATPPCRASAFAPASAPSGAPGWRWRR